VHRLSSRSEAEGMRVLVVDDEHNVRQIISSVLAKGGCKVIEAENGLQGLTFAKQYPCDLVITDEVLPLLDGLEMISRLAAERYPARYLLISGYDVNPPVRSGLPFLSKPFTSNQLIDAVGRLLHEPTLPQLENEWRQAKARWQEAVTEFKETIFDVPSGILHPDGTQRIERAALKQRIMHERYLQALQKYREVLQACGVLGATTEESGPQGKSE
jgi:YesN/AraC family two-component response regulator